MRINKRYENWPTGALCQGITNHSSIHSLPDQIYLYLNNNCWNTVTIPPSSGFKRMRLAIFIECRFIYEHVWLASCIEYRYVYQRMGMATCIEWICLWRFGLASYISCIFVCKHMGLASYVERWFVFDRIWVATCIECRFVY